MAGKLFFIVAGVYLAALLGAWWTVPQVSSLSVQGSHAKASAVQSVGMSLTLYHLDDLRSAYEAVDGIVALGCNSLQVVTPVFQEHGGSPTVNVRIGPGLGPSEDQILAVLGYAQSKGLRTALLPQVNFTAPRGNEWRGKLTPRQWSVWWDSYETMLDHFLTLAQKAQVQVFCVGCELLTTQKPEHLERWRSLIGRARKRFDGTLVYATNWDSYATVGFWDQLDAIGISAYWDLTLQASDPEHPTDAELDAGWQTIRQQLLAYAETQKRPVLFTELGYPGLPWALDRPWNYIAAANTLPDLKAQDAGYRAFVRAWGDLIPSTDPRLAGVFFYTWDLYRPSPDTGYSIDGKPAQKTVQQWLDP